MYEEPTDSEYGRMMDLANKNASTDGFRCIHCNLRWNGYWITTPNGNKYCLVDLSTSFLECRYYICEYRQDGSYGQRIAGSFDSLRDAKLYIKIMKM